MTIIKLADEATNDDAIELVEGLLERLKSGESVAVAIVEVLKRNTVATVYTSNVGSYHLLNSGAARLAARLANEPDDD